MKIFIPSLEMTNFKGHTTFKAEFGEIVKVTGKNGEGKSSIGDAITWCLYGTDTFGSQLDPTPVNEFEGEISSTILMQVDDKTIKLKRAIEGGKNTFYINDVPKKATEYKELIDSLFDKNLFLTIFNPSYFPSQNWKEQRAQLLQYIAEPFNKEVFENMENVHKVVLEEALKKHNLGELSQMHKDRFKKRDKEIERAGAKVATLKEQYEKAMGSEAADLEEVVQKLKDAEMELKKGQSINESIEKKERAIQELEMKDKFIREQIMKKKALLDQMKEMPFQEHCAECGQALDYNSREQAKHKHLDRVESVKLEGKDLVSELGEIKKHREELGEPEERVDLSELQKKMNHYQHILMDKRRIEELADDIKDAEGEYDFIRAERNESQSINEAVKSFIEVKAALMVHKVNSLFNSLSVKLFERQKNESIKQTFEIEKDGKPYSKLSTAERINAGCELIMVLQDISGVEGPTFYDNAESVIQLQNAPGQSIIARVENTELTIQEVQLT